MVYHLLRKDIGITWIDFNVIDTAENTCTQSYIIYLGYSIFCFFHLPQGQNKYQPVNNVSTLPYMSMGIDYTRFWQDYPSFVSTRPRVPSLGLVETKIYN